MKIILSILLVFISFSSWSVQSEEMTTERRLEVYKIYSEFKEINKFGEKVTIYTEQYGKKPNEKPINNKNLHDLDFIFKDKFNVAAIVQKKDQIVYETYNNGFDQNTPLNGTSASKTVGASVIGQLLCDGLIESLDDPMGKYSPSLKETLWANISIKNALLMQSGITNGRSDEDDIAWRAKGIHKHYNVGDAIKALQVYKKPFRDQGVKHNYHVSDSLSLSILAQDITGMSLGKNFYEKQMLKYSPDGYFHWMTDHSGRTLSFAELVMTAREWHRFAKFIYDEMNNKSCLGNFFLEGIENSIPMGSQGHSDYGYQSRVYDVNNSKILVAHGGGGRYMMLYPEKEIIVTVLSISPDYSFANISKNIEKVLNAIDKTLTKN